MSIDLFFGAPLIVRDVDRAVHETIRKKVAAYLASDRAKHTVTPSPEESVATSFYRRDASILADAELEELEAIVLSTARAYLEQTLKLPPRRLEIEHAWVNIFEPGAQEGQHTHDGSLLSCSYYVEAPENCGHLVFPDPVDARRSYREFTQTAGEELLNRRNIAVEPQPGRLVMFESWMPHYVQCNKGDGVRISIAINLRGLPVSVSVSRSGSAVEAASGVAAKGGTAAAGTLGSEAPGRGEKTASSADSGAVSRDGKPFLFNDLFDVSANLHIVRVPIRNAIPTIVIDDFLKRAESVREIIGSTPATNWKHEPGGRNFRDYYDCRLRFPIRYPNSMIAAAQQAIRQVYGVNTRPADASVDVNWFMQIHEKRAEFAVPHNDVTENVARSFTCIVYLNRREECSGGTAFFRFKKSSSLILDEAYAKAVQEDSRIAETGLDYWPEATEDAWELMGAVDMAPGRLVIFPSEYFHAAYHPQNFYYDFPRLTLVFWMVC